MNKSWMIMMMLFLAICQVKQFTPDKFDIICVGANNLSFGMTVEKEGATCYKIEGEQVVKKDCEKYIEQIKKEGKNE